jgi:hypothetical protein
MSRFLLPLLSIAIVLSLFGGTPALAGEWDDEFPITQDPVLQYRSELTVGPDDTTYVLWPDWTDWDDTKIMLTKSGDKGKTWTAPTEIFGGTAYDNLDILADDRGVHLLLVDFKEAGPNEYKKLYYSKSTDNGATFSSLVRIGAQENIEQISLFSGCGYLVLFAKDYFNGNLLYTSTDGTVWDEMSLMSGTPIQNPDILIKDDVIHMTFGGDLYTPGIKYCKSADWGRTWSTPVFVSQGAGGHSQLPKMAMQDQTIHIAWEDDRENYFNIMYSQSTDGGATWSTDVRINDTFYGARNRLLADEEGLHILWCQYHGTGWPTSWGSYDYGIIWYKFSDNGGQKWTNEFRVSQNDFIPPLQYPDLGANVVRIGEYALGFCAMWQDKRDGNYDLYMRNLNFHPVTADVIGPSQVKRGSNLSFSVTLTNVVDFGVPLTRVYADVSGPQTLTIPLW